MPIRKRILVARRIRKPPTEGWSWIDRRFLREHAPSLSRDAVLLYFFLTAVSDKVGLSYYSDTTIGARLRMEAVDIAHARDELDRRDLIAYEPPLYQVLSIEPSVARHRDSRPTVIGEIFREFSEARSRRAP